jgi:hypothetical protein
MLVSNYAEGHDVDNSEVDNSDARHLVFSTSDVFLQRNK